MEYQSISFNQISKFARVLLINWPTVPPSESGACPGMIMRDLKRTQGNLFEPIGLKEINLNSSELIVGVKSNWDSFHSIRKFMIPLIRKGKKSLKNLINLKSKFVRFEKFEILFLSKSILCCSILSFLFKGTLFW